MVYTLDLLDELASHADRTSDVTGLCTLTAGGRLDGQVELERSWREPAPGLDALLHVD